MRGLHLSPAILHRWKPLVAVPETVPDSRLPVEPHPGEDQDH
jgi:hypothetical protein